MLTIKKRELIVDIVSTLFILLFLYAAITKLMDYEKFRIQLGQSPLLTSIAPIVAWGVPIVEIVVAAMLVIFRFRLMALYAAFSLMVMFTAYIIAITQFSDYVPCSCGGILEKMGWSTHLLFNSLFVVLAFIAILLESKGNKFLIKDNAY